MNILTIITWIVRNRKSLFNAVCSLAVGLLLAWSITLSKQNKRLSESLETAQNDIEAYQGIVNDSQQANNVLKLDIKTLRQQNDKLLQQIDSVREELKIKKSEVTTAATQTQTLSVNGGKGVEGDLVEILKDSIYNDSIQYNPLTLVHYTIGRDTVNIQIDLKNTQYLYIFTKREYANKKSFIKRLFTFDFKKVNRYRYEIVNTNDLIKTDDVRIVESNK